MVVVHMNEWMAWVAGGGILTFLLWLLGKSDPSTSEDPPIPKKPAAVPARVWKWRSLCVRASNLTNVDPDFILAVLWRESNGDRTATNSAGERGLMQVTPIAMEDVTGTRQPAPFDPAQNIYRGAQYLQLMKRRYTDGTKFAMARGYNEGPPPFTKEASREYAEDVLNNYEVIREFWNRNQTS